MFIWSAIVSTFNTVSSRNQTEQMFEIFTVSNKLLSQWTHIHHLQHNNKLKLLSLSWLSLQYSTTKIVTDFLLEWNLYDKACQELTSMIMDIWNDSENWERCRISVPLLFAPANYSNLSMSDCWTILCSTFKFIQ